MTTTKAITAHRVFGIVLSIAVLVAGICLASGCLYIYYTGGDHPYSRESVATVFSAIAVPVFACLLLTVIGFVWEWFSPLPVKKARSTVDRAWQVKRLSDKKDMASADTSTASAIQSERQRRRIHATLRTVLIILASVLFAVYALNSANYDTSDINRSMIRAMMVLLPCAVIPFGYSIFTVYSIDKSYQRELSLLKTLPNATVTATEDDAHKATPIIVIRTVLLLITVAILLYGFFAGGTADVLTKAVNICTECIGLG